MDQFTLDAMGASVKDQKVRQDGDNIVVRTEFDNGFIWIYTNTPTGFKRIDFSHAMALQSDGSYRPMLDKPKSDFYDYF